MVGHGQKNTNRGQAINRNAARIKKLAEKLGELGEIVKKVKTGATKDLDEISVMVDEWFTETEERLRLLERPWWKRLLRRELNPPIINLENVETEVEDAEGREEKVAAAGDTEPPASGSGSEDARTEGEEGEAGGV